MKIRNKLLLFILSSVFIVTFCMIYLSYVTSRKALVAEIQDNAHNMLDKYRAIINVQLSDVVQIAQSEGAVVENDEDITEEEVKGLIKEFVGFFPGVYGSTISFVPGAYKSRSGLFGPYYHRAANGEDLEYVDLAAPSYDYPKWEWFKRPVETNKPFWTKPYVDEGGGNIAMITYAYPFFRNGKVRGVSTVDISLKQLTREIEKIKIGESGYAFVLDSDGTFLSMRRNEAELKNTIFDEAKKRQAPDLEKLGRDMASGKDGFISMMNPLIGKRAWFVYGPLSAADWSVAIVLPEDELLSSLQTLHRNIIMIAMAGMLFISFIVFFISSRISRPIGLLAESANKISKGELHTKIPVLGSKDEIGVLSRSFSGMTSAILKTIDQIKEEKEMFRVAFSQMTDGIVILDTHCSVIQFNHAAEKLLMLPAEGPFREHLMAHFDGDLPLSEGGSCNKERSAVFKLSRRETGELGPLHLECEVSSVTDSSGQLKEHILSVRDITGQEVEEQSKRNFLSLMSHKLFTPLNAMQGKLMLFKDGLLGALDEKQMKCITSMVDQTGKLNNLITSLVNFVSLEESKIDTTREDIEMRKLLEEILVQSKQWYAAKQPEVIINVEPEAEHFNFNRRYLSIIIAQLIENGLKFNLNEKAKVSVDCRRMGHDMVIHVGDDGIGIPPEFIDKIFDKFFQIEKYYTGNIEGVGLGLAYVKKLVETFKGTISVQSAPGKGSTFTVMLPTA